VAGSGKKKECWTLAKPNFQLSHTSNETTILKVAESMVKYRSIATGDITNTLEPDQKIVAAK
jgi:hypothetical protein